MKTNRKWSAYLRMTAATFGDRGFYDGRLEKIKDKKRCKGRDSDFHIEYDFFGFLPCWKCFSKHKGWFEKAYERVADKINNYDAAEVRQACIEHLSQEFVVQILKTARDHFKDRSDQFGHLPKGRASMPRADYLLLIEEFKVIVDKLQKQRELGRKYDEEEPE